MNIHIILCNIVCISVLIFIFLYEKHVKNYNILVKKCVSNFILSRHKKTHNCRVQWVINTFHRIIHSRINQSYQHIAHLNKEYATSRKWITLIFTERKKVDIKWLWIFYKRIFKGYISLTDRRAYAGHILLLFYMKTNVW